MSLYAIQRRAPDGAMVTVTVVESMAERAVEAALVARETAVVLGRLRARGQGLADHHESCVECRTATEVLVRAKVAQTRGEYEVVPL